jgi:hypothetical protein
MFSLRAGRGPSLAHRRCHDAPNATRAPRFPAFDSPQLPRARLLCGARALDRAPRSDPSGAPRSRRRPSSTCAASRRFGSRQLASEARGRVRRPGDPAGTTDPQGRPHRDCAPRRGPGPDARSRVLGRRRASAVHAGGGPAPGRAGVNPPLSSSQDLPPVSRLSTTHEESVATPRSLLASQCCASRSPRELTRGGSGDGRH